MNRTIGKRIKNIAKKGFLLLMLLSLVPVFSASDASAAKTYQLNYTYTYDYWEIAQESPDAYSVLTTLSMQDFGLKALSFTAQGLFVKGNSVYICDTGNNYVIELLREGSEFHLVRVIDSFTGDVENNTFSSPSDIFVMDNGDMFICDTNNGRIVKLDKDLNYLMSFVKPTDATYDQAASFLPLKAVADTTGRMYVLGKNVNKGFIKFEANGVFSGYIGANEVKYTARERLQRTFSTKAQREQQEQFVPTEYNNVAIDSEGFLYATNSVFDAGELRSEAAKPIRKLNSLGTDILIRNGNSPVVGDLDWGSVAGKNGPSKLVDVTALDNGCYFAIDRVRGHIFGYNDQGQMLYGFGGSGNADGYFTQPTAIEHMGTDLLILDSSNAKVTVMTTTEFGALIFKGIEEYKAGNYDKSAEYYERVLTLNGNYDLAYIGIGRALLRQERYKEAMEYFEIKWDVKNYSKAYQLYRKEWVEEHIIPIFALLVIVIVAPLVIGRIKKVKKEVEAYAMEKGL